MRHQKRGRKLNRGRNQRKALLRSLALNLIKYSQIQTTEAKAKAIRPLVDKLLTRAKGGTLADQRRLFAFLRDVASVERLMKELVPKFAGRTSGFTRLVKLGRRTGDNAMMVRMEWVEFSPVEEAPKKRPVKSA